MENKDTTQTACPFVKENSQKTLDEGDIGMLEIFRILWAKRLLILVITFLVMATTFIYLLISPASYETKVKLSSPLSYELEKSLSVIDEVFPIFYDRLHVAAEDRFNLFCNNLQDEAIQNRFWKESEIAKKSTGTGDNFNGISKTWFMQNIRLIASKHKKGLMIASLTGPNPDVLSMFLNAFIFYVDNYTSQAVIDAIEANIINKRIEIEKRIERLRKIAEGKKKQQIEKVKEQLEIARKLKIFKQPEEIPSEPLYARGVNVLQAEIEILTHRKDNDFLIGEIPMLQSSLNFLNEIDFSKVIFSNVLSQDAIVPASLKKKKRKYMVVLSFPSGALLGIFLVILMNFTSNLKQLLNEQMTTGSAPTKDKVL